MELVVDNAQSTIHPLYTDLPHIDTVTRWSEAEDGACFEELADVMVEAGCTTTYSIILLHQHFPVYHDEIMLARFASPARLTMSPARTDGATQSFIVPSAWRLIDQQGALVPTPFEWIATSDAEVALCHFGPEHEKTLMELGDVLRRHDALARFGFRLMIASPDCAPDVVVVETTSVDARTLTLVPEPDTTINQNNYVETTWIVSEGSEPIHAALFCKKKKSSYCSTYCKGRCVGTQFSHDPEHKGRFHRKATDSVHYE